MLTGHKELQLKTQVFPAKSQHQAPRLGASKPSQDPSSPFHTFRPSPGHMGRG